MKWKDKLIKSLVELECDDEFWNSKFHDLLNEYSFGIHLAIFSEPFFSLLFSGAKRMESRFSYRMVSPFGDVRLGDVILVKLSGGEISGAFIAGNVSYYQNLSNKRLKELEENYGDLICASADPNFWSSRESKKYATLIEVTNLIRLPTIKSWKNDRRGWIVLRKNLNDSLFAEMK